ncbi:hypothetical protein M5X17_27585 [Paenibacillus alvei]|uniref:PIN domain-containing protein n=1 Tax=Paenibacillus alvei TaxID=44250 RepID=UPI0022802E65|nr:PIN domain-containing protein [Paenibacillus alvei]MCY9737468.1 hypothetical protein [Paenibacillus alvei]
MKKIDFNDPAFNGFEEGENVLLDTGILLALFIKDDSWHEPVTELFENYITNSDNTVFLYTNPTIINELSHITTKGLDSYLRGHNLSANEGEKGIIKQTVKDNVKTLIENEILIVLDGSGESVLKQLELSEKLGAADAVNASIANEFGISFLTVDSTLVTNMDSVRNELSNINNLYYTTGAHRKHRRRVEHVTVGRAR